MISGNHEFRVIEVCGEFFAQARLIRGSGKWHPWGDGCSSRDEALAQCDPPEEVENRLSLMASHIRHMEGYLIEIAASGDTWSKSRASLALSWRGK